jgi:Icc-related predicted phosphoesterase
MSITAEKHAVKLLLFSDLHADSAAAQRLVERSRAVDLVIGAGDFANVRRNLQGCIDILRAIERPSVLVAGNNETTDELRKACCEWPAAHVLHGTGIVLNDLMLYGVGGGIPITPFGAWSYDFSEEQARSLLAYCPMNCILVTHSPPFGAVDVSSQGKHLGSQAIREAIARLQPRLVVCGHIHASAEQQVILGKTPIINAGPNGVEWQMTMPE